MAEAFIKIHRKILEWEWYKDTNTFFLFLHCLLIANWKDGRFMGCDVPRGSFVSSYSELAQQTNMSVQNVRTAINHLKSTGELTVNSHAKFSIFTVVKYNRYQDDNRQTNKQLTGNQQTVNNQLTTIEEYKEKKEEKEIKNNKYICAFEEFWNIYPRTNDKARAYKCYQARLKDGYSEEQLLTACKNYAKACAENKTEQKYIKYAATFLSVNEPFLDYLKGEEHGNNIDDEEQRNREIDEILRRKQSGEADHDDDGLWDR